MRARPQTLTRLLWECRRAPAMRALLAAFIGLLLTFTVLLLVELRGPGSPPVTITPDQLQLRQGEGETASDRLMIRQEGANDTSIVLARLPAIEAHRYGRLQWQLDGLTDDQDLKLLWVSNQAPQQIRTLLLTDAQKQQGAVDLTTNVDWTGQISLIGIAVGGALSQPLTLTQISLIPAPRTVAGSVRNLLRPWYEREPWSMRSINYREHPENQWQTSPLMQATLWLVISAGTFLILSINTSGQARRTVLVALLLLAWLGLDAQWQWQLLTRLQETHERHGDTPPGMRGPITDVDAWVADLVGGVRKYLRPKDARIVLVTKDPAEQVPLRVRYRLLPLNVSPGQTRLPDASRMQAGDYLLLIQPPPDIRYRPDIRVLGDETHQVPVESVAVMRGMAALYRVRAQ